ncbi:hypothetical protein BJY01DRAFT_191558 [Aspergillus pseudoustus]|uniref:Uncharacterized protein n=1 Tax=Aspergillus pseudoustus TaxID=1810923 RepID=A0ABR4JVQ1_9EURO
MRSPKECPVELWCSFAIHSLRASSSALACDWLRSFSSPGMICFHHTLVLEVVFIWRVYGVASFDFLFHFCSRLEYDSVLQAFMRSYMKVLLYASRALVYFSLIDNRR